MVQTLCRGQADLRCLGHLRMVVARGQKLRATCSWREKTELNSSCKAILSNQLICKRLRTFSVFLLLLPPSPVSTAAHLTLLV